MVVETTDVRHPAPAHAAEPETGSGAASETASAVPAANPEILGLVKDDSQVVRLESGQVLFAEGDTSNCMYVVKTGALRIRSGSVVYEDVGPGGIVGEMGLVEGHQPRSAMVYALADSELIAVDDARFFALVAETPRFALMVMQVLSRRLRAMDRRYRPDPRL